MTTLLDTTISGRIYSFCPVTNTITLAEDRESSNGASSQTAATSDNNSSVDYRIIKSAFIKGVSILERPAKSNDQESSKKERNAGAAFHKATPAIGPVKIEYLPQEEREGIKQLIRERATSGVGVSAEAQSLFNALHKLVPCHWNDKAIIALDEVRIDPPYSPESCTLLHKSQDTKSLNYVKMVVKGLQDNVKGG